MGACRRRQAHKGAAADLIRPLARPAHVQGPAAARRPSGRTPWPAGRALGRVLSVGLVIAALTAACGGSAGSNLTAHRATTARPGPGVATATATATATARAPSPTRWTLPAGASLVAFARHRLVVVHGLNPRARSWRLHNPNEVGAPLVFLVVGQRADGWAVRVPARPNGSIGVVRRSDVRVEVDPYSVRVSLHRRLLTIYRYGHAIRRYPVGVGRPSAPTPTGHYYLTELLQPHSTDTPYGPFAYGTSAFSDVYSEFEGGPGQIGMHGTSDPSSIGRNVSHGCIRLHNSDMARVARLVPAGTPVIVSA